MPRPRSRKWAWLPENVYFKRGRYVIRIKKSPYKETFLCAGDATRAEVYQEAAKYDQREQDNTLAALINDYLKSEKFLRLEPATQESYTRHLLYLKDWTMPRLRRPFGSLLLSEIGNPTIQSAFDQQKPDTARNRRFTVLKAVYSWGMQRYPVIHKNPVVGLEMPPEPPRDRYVTDAEYQAVYALASPMLRVMMEGAYLLRARGQELRKLRRIDNVLEHGVLIERDKGSWDGVVTWSPRLRQWVRDCKMLNPSVVSPWLIHNAEGGPVTKSSLDSMWRRVWAKNPPVERFTFHDLKAKGVTDHPTKEGGHRSEKMREVYDRVNRLEEPTK